MALDPLRTTTMVLIPPNGASLIQGSQVIPAPTMQTSGMVQFVQYQQVGSTSNQPQQSPQAGRLEKLRQVETKTLGAIQIIIGLIHIGFGSISFMLCYQGYIPLACLTGYPFWGGIFFIVSGSLSVAAEKHLSTSLVKWSVGMNITSAIMSSVGIIVYIIQLAVHSHHYYMSNYDSKVRFVLNISHGFSILLLFFSLLEFCITATLVHFGCQATCCYGELMTAASEPYAVSGGSGAPAEAQRPPTYHSVQFSSKGQAE